MNRTQKYKIEELLVSLGVFLFTQVLWVLAWGMASLSEPADNRAPFIAMKVWAFAMATAVTVGVGCWVVGAARALWKKDQEDDA